MIPGNANPLLLASAAEAAAAAAGPIKSVRFNSSDSATLSRAFSSTGNQKTATLSFWVKRCKLGVNQYVYDSSSTNTTINLDGNDNLVGNMRGTGSTNYTFITNAKLRDPSAWYHIVVAWDTSQATSSNRLDVYINGVEQTFSSVSYPPQNTLLFTNDTRVLGNLSGASIYLDAMLADIYFIDGSQLDATSFGAFDDNGVWQAAEYSGTFGTNGFHLLDFANESTIGHDSSGNENDFTAVNFVSSSSANTTGVTTTVPQDVTGDWLEILNVTPTDTNGPVAVFPDGGGIANTKGTFYWSGLTSGDTITWYGTSTGESSRQVTGNISESTVAVPGASLGSISLTVTAASGSAKIDFNGSANCYGITPGVVSSSLFDDVFDVPTNGTQSDTGAGGEVSGCYATLNPLDRKSTVSLSNGNLDATTSTTGWAGVKGTMGVSSGKYYFEATANGSAANKVFFGICASSVKPDTSGYLQDDSTERAKGMLIFCDDGKYQLDGNSRVSYSSSMADGDVIAVAYDLDGNTVQFYKNGSALGSIDISSSPLASTTVVPLYIHYNTNTTYHLNFGQRPFAYSAPSGYSPLCTTLLPTPTIADGSDYFDVKTWSGTGAENTLTGFEFSPDMIWVKRRNNSTDWHNITDTVRGATNTLYPNDTYVDTVASQNVKAFTSDGVTLGTFSGVNASGGTYVGWAWDAGSSTVSNTDGSITSNVRANPSAGFSIVSYSSASNSVTVGHGLNAAPEFIILKDRNNSYDWVVITTLLANTTDYLVLNSTAASADFGVDAPTSTTFTPSQSANSDYIAYCFAPVAGFSAFGSYEGNGSTTAGPFIYTGFRSRWLLIKRSNSTDNWAIYDTARDPENRAESLLRPNTAGAEDSSDIYNRLDILSNGFKIRPDNATYGLNVNGGEFIYAAFAENPFQANGGLAR